MLDWLLQGTQVATSTSAWLRINADSGANYSEQAFQRATSTVSGTTNEADVKAILGLIPAASTPDAHDFGFGRILLPYYRHPQYKQLVQLSGSPKTAALVLQTWQTMSTTWRNTAAINQLTLLLPSANYAIGSRATLWAW